MRFYLTNAQRISFVLLSCLVMIVLSIRAEGLSAQPRGIRATPTPGGEVRLSFRTAEVGELTARLEVVLEAGDLAVGGMQNDLLFDTRMLRLPRASACRINPEIGDRLAACDEEPIVEPCKRLARSLVSCGDDPLPAGCPSADPILSRFRGIVAAFAIPNQVPIPNGSVLYSCEFDLMNGATLPANLRSTNLIAADTFGTRLPSVADQDVDFPLPTPTASPSATQSPTSSPTETPTERPTSTATPSPSATPTAVNTVPASATATSTVTPSATATATPIATTPGSTVETRSGGCRLLPSASTGRADAIWLLLLAFTFRPLGRRFSRPGRCDPTA